MTTVLNGFLDGLKQTFARVKRDFKHMLDRNMYITFYHKDLVSPIVVGPLNFKEETIESMVKKYETKITDLEQDVMQLEKVHKELIETKDDLLARIHETEANNDRFNKEIKQVREINS